MDLSFNLYISRSKNKLIEMLEHENRSCDESFKELINEYHVNIRSGIREDSISTGQSPGRVALHAYIVEKG